MVKNKKISPLTAIFLKWKDQNCLFQFWFFFFTVCFKLNQSRCTEIDINFQFSLMDENRMDERYTHPASPCGGRFVCFSIFDFHRRRKLKRTFWFSRFSNKSDVFYFHWMRRRFSVRGILIVTPIDFSVMVVISRFGLDEK